MSADHHDTIIERFAAVCAADERVLAAFVGGSVARGTADAYSDIDLYLITTDEALGDFVTGSREFIRRLGEPLFLERFGYPNLIFFILGDGTEGELGVGRAGDFAYIHSGPYRVLLDRSGLLEGMVFAGEAPDPAEQVEQVRRLVMGFWHDLAHFISALGRGQLWWAAGQLEALRGMAVSLSRLAHDFGDGEATDEPYFKVDNQLPGRLLEPLRRTFVPLEREAMLDAVESVLAYFRATAAPLAAGHDLPYPAALDALMSERLARLRQ